MPTVQNRNTTQQPMSASGITGQQVVKYIPASRIYVKIPDSVSKAPVQQYYAVSNGQTPAGWVDLGTIDGPVAVSYDMKVAQETAGLENTLRYAYLASLGASMSFTLGQVDDKILQQVSGLLPSVITQGSIVSYPLGSANLNQLAILLVMQDKLTGKETQFYNPKAYIAFDFDYTPDAKVLKCQAFLPFFTPINTTVDSVFSVTIFAPPASQVIPSSDSSIFLMNLTKTLSVIVPHNLNSFDVVPSLVGKFGDFSQYGDFRLLDANNALLTFAVPFTGELEVEVFTGKYMTQNVTASTSVTFNHPFNTTALGVCVYDATNLVTQYGDLITPNTSTATVTFNPAFTGRVILFKLT